MEDEGVHCVRYDTTVDELVDVNIRLTTRTRAFRSSRARAVSLAGGLVGVTILVSVYFRGRQENAEFSALFWGIVVGLTTMFSTGLAYGYGRYLDWTMRRHYKRIVSEELGGAAEFPCSIELRPGGVWVLQNGIEFKFSWNNTAGIEDMDDAIELRFNPGLIVVHNRAFRDVHERSRFLERARELATISRRQAG